jgi:glc operon protein GlcG
MRLIFTLGILPTSWLGVTGYASAQLPQRPVLTLEAATRIADAAQAEAARNGWNVVIAIVDDGGHTVHLRRMDGTQVGSVVVAQEKAKSAIYFRRPTKAFADAVASGRTAVLRLPGAVPIEGGIPLAQGNQMVGAIGVSGVTSEQDGQIAAAGIKALSPR